MAHAIKYELPTNWIKYHSDKELLDVLADALGSVKALQFIPFQRRWVKELQEMQLKLEVGGTSRIEGADFVGNELEAAMKAETADQLLTRSQKQAAAAKRAYELIGRIEEDRPITVELIHSIHRVIVTDCDDDHCPPGTCREKDHNVSFGTPTHRGVEGGQECAAAMERLAYEVQTSYRSHPPMIQALALHYHFAAMHPYADGNGRTARALEALMLQRAGLKDSLFIAMSNFYYEEKRDYLGALAEVRKRGQDLTPFLMFGLRGIARQTTRLSMLIKRAVSKEIFRNMMLELFTRLESTRKRVIVRRQLELLEKLLSVDGEIEFYTDFVASIKQHYVKKKDPLLAIVRDMNKLINLGAVRATVVHTSPPKTVVSVNLDWPATITESEVFAKLADLPTAKSTRFLVSSDGAPSLS